MQEVLVVVFVRKYVIKTSLKFGSGQHLGPVPPPPPIPRTAFVSATPQEPFLF